MTLIACLAALALCLAACGAQTTAADPEPTVEPTPEVLTLGSLTVTSELTAIDLEQTGASLEDLMRLSGKIDGVSEISLGVTRGTLAQLQAVRAAFPNAHVSWEAALPGGRVADDVQELDLSAATDDEVPDICAALALLPELRTIHLAGEGDVTALSFESLDAIAAAAPEAELNCRFELFGQTADWTTEELRYDHSLLGDDCIDAFRAALPYLRALHLLRLEECGIEDHDAMAALRADFPEKNVVWSVNIGGYPCMTDTTRVNAALILRDDNTYLLQYMPDVLYLDIGHNAKLTNIEFARYFPKLQVVILTLTNIADLSPLEDCKDLEFLECHSCQISDLSPLADKDKLEYLNIANLPNLTDLSPLYGLKNLKIVRICGSTWMHITKEQVEELKAQLPDTFVSDYGGDPNSSGSWRFNPNGGLTERYQLLREQMGYDLLNWKLMLFNSPSGGVA